MKRFKSILVYADQDQQETAIRRAITLAMENDADLTIMEVIKPPSRATWFVTQWADPAELQRLIVEDHRKQLMERASEYIDTGIAIDVVVKVGDPACQVVKKVIDDEHDLVIKTADGLSLAGRIFGSVSRSLLRICPCPVWVLKPEVHGDFDQIVAAVDLDTDEPVHLALNQQIMELAFAIAERDAANVHVVSAWDLWMERSLRRRSGHAEVDAALSAYERKLRDALDTLVEAQHGQPKSVEVHFIRGNPSAVIESIGEKHEVDLIVMGTVCRSGAAGLLIGNTAESLLEHVTCSVLALKPEGFVSPVQEHGCESGTDDEQLPLI
ncbi:universal stress protein [Novipirellula artificiosorum]|uniref:Universal stress protein E n=1 Tax=Novipirellula artificiosorum TaxID=2528016 RepID=A0A5C6DUG4_9BACT|nr:universal stress protein [Novipirellula artificiosorum]TWU38409.1 Universal stress protein E [Novipirellula artificiosorum]